MPAPASTPALDRLADLARRVLDAPSAQVNLVDDVHRVVAGSGAAAVTVGIESPVAETACRLVVDAAEPVAIPDATADPRVSQLEGVTSGLIGAYLGVPLLDAHGRAIGALCVFAPSPRRWSEGDASLLEALAAPVMAEIELAALSAEYENDRAAWEIAVDAGGIGAWDWDLVTGELRWDDRLLTIFGLDRDTFGGTIEAFNATVHPDDLAGVGESLEKAIATGGTFSSEYRVVRPGGEISWVAARGRALVDVEGTATRLIGAAYDTTAVREGDVRVTRVLEAMPSAFYNLDPQWRFTYLNAAACLLLGRTREELLGGDVWELFPASLDSDFEVSYRRAAETGRPVAFEAYYPPPLDAWYQVNAWPTPDGLSVYFSDITEVHEARLLREEAARRAEVVASLSGALTGTLDAHEAVRRLAEAVVPLLGDWCVVSLVDPEDRGDWRRRVRDDTGRHADELRQPLVDRYVETRLDALLDVAFLRRALVEGEVIEISAGATAGILSVMAPGTEAVELCRELAPESALILPLVARDRTVGVLSIYRDAGRPPISVGDRETLGELVTSAALALDNARLYAEQRDLAEGLQRSMLTEPPQADHLQIEVRYEPAAQAAQVGGDWYDSFKQRSGDLVVVIGDVIGHDTAAAAAMGQVRGLLRGIAVHTGATPAAVLRGVDEVMETLEVQVTATAVVARLEQDDELRAQGLTRVRWSSAGHPPPLVLDPEGVVTELEAPPELLLGVDPGTDREDHVALLRRGSVLVLFTDGLVERRGQTLDQGLTALRGHLGDLGGERVELGVLCDRLLTLMQPAKPEDDVAIVAVALQ